MTTPTHSARSPKTERWLDDLGAAWTFDPDLPLHRIDQAASLANQVRHNPLDVEVVERYAADMRQGDEFPAVIVDAEGLGLLGGNHRFAAKVAANHSTIGAYLVTADARTLLRIRVEDNRNHGLPTTNAERIDHAIALVASGLTQQEAARITGVPGPKVTTIVGCRAAAERIERLGGADGFHRLPETSRYALSQIDHDDVFSAAVDLTLAAGLPLADVRTIVSATSAVEAVEALRIIGQMTGDFEDRITENAGNVRKASLSQRAKLDAALATIVGLDPQAIYDSCPNDDVRAVLAQRIMRAAAVLAPAQKLLAPPVAKGRAA